SYFTYTSNFLFFFLMIRLPPISTLFPYTTLFRSLFAKSLLQECIQDSDTLLSIQMCLLNLLLQYSFEKYSKGKSQNHSICILRQDRKSTRLNSSHVKISYAVFCLKKKKKK